jgi:hypothetical protein
MLSGTVVYVRWMRHLFDVNESFDNIIILYRQLSYHIISLHEISKYFEETISTAYAVAPAVAVVAAFVYPVPVLAAADSLALNLIH